MFNKIIRSLYFLSIVVAIFFTLSCQSKEPPITGEISGEASAGWLQGYAKTIKGGVLSYHSPHPDVTSSLLVRSLDSENDIAWETESIPSDIEANFLTFIWLFGIDVEPITRAYDLYVNDSKWFTFSNPKSDRVNEWTISGPYESSLHFRVTLVDRYNDLMGYAALRLPASKFPKGKPVRLRVVGETAGSRMWYMTFQSEVKVGAKALPLPALVKRGEDLYQPVEIHIVHLGEPAQVKLTAAELPEMSARLEYGFNLVRMYFPKIQKLQEDEIRIEIADRSPSLLRFQRKPVKPWTLYLVQHTHTDIGYTRPQTEILAEHLRFIDYALDYCDLTDDYPEEARFRWTCEASWAVNEFLKSRPQEQLHRLRQRVQEGRIEITGMPFNLSEIADENVLRAALQPLKGFKKAGLSVTTAMQNDVNGIAWCLADYFPGLGIKYLNMGQHGHRARIPFDKPTAFWWESPSGKRVLAFRADHYMTGNFWGIHTDNFSNAGNELLKYLRGLEDKSYPLEHIAVQYSGYYTDNAPPSTAGSEFIRSWNEEYAWPKLRSATAREFFQYLEEQHDIQLPVHRVAWPDWWSDGFGSAARETAAARKTQMFLLANKGLLSLASLLGEPLPGSVWEQIEKIEQALLFWDEHTMGAAESISDPLAENSIIQWAEKAAYVWEAVKDNRLLQEAAMGMIQHHIPRQDVPTIAVFNTLNWPRSGLVEIYIDHEILPPGRELFILDENSLEIAAQAGESRADGTYWYLWGDDLPAFGYKTYRLEVSDKIRETIPSALTEDTRLENDFYSLEIDVSTGGIVSLLDKELGKELCDPNSPWKLGQIIHETISNRAQLEQYRLLGHTRDSLSDIRMEGLIEGPIWKSLILSGKTGTAVDDTRLQCEIRLFNKSKRLELHYALRKKAINDPEAVYVAFPFGITESRISYEAQGGIVYPGKNQLEGTSADWHAMQNFVTVGNSRSEVILGSQEIPLTHLGGLNLGNFRYLAKIEQPHVYSWVMNNYWVTNFRASQEGDFRWSYYLTSGKFGESSLPTRFAWGSRVPLLARVFPAGKTSKLPQSRSFLQLHGNNILLISAQPTQGRKGLFLHLREISGRTTEAYITLPWEGNAKAGFFEVNALGESLTEKVSRLEFEPYETRFIRLPLER